MDPPARGRQRRVGLVTSGIVMRSNRQLASLLVTAAALGLLLYGCGGSATPQFEGPRHVILISLDTTRSDHLGFSGSRARTPHLDRFAAESIVFENAMTAAPTTLAAHTSILTGAYPQSHGVPRNGFFVNDENVMLAELLSDRGFSTAAFLGSFALESRFGFDQGFDVFDESFDIRVDRDSYDQNQRRAAAVTDAVLAEIDDSFAERRFLFVHYFDPHSPYDPPPPYNTMYARSPNAPKRADLTDLGASAAAHQKAITGRSRAVFRQGLTRELLEGATGEPRSNDEDYAALYAGEVSYLDEHLGRLFDGLDERGLLDEALVILTADHGETFYEHADFWNHGLWAYQTTVHVPLVVRLPSGEAGGTRIDTPVSTVDIVPTICEALGIDPPARVQGTSLAAAWDASRPLADRTVYCEATQPVADAIERDTPWTNFRKPKALRRGSMKYVFAPYLGVEQLFDLATDPDERNDLLLEPTPEAAAVRNEFRTMITELAKSMPEPLPSSFNPEQEREVIERLRQLGYEVGSDDE